MAMEHIGSATLPVTDIILNDRLRQVDEAHAHLLAENMQQTGCLRTPIEVRQVKTKTSLTYTLIAGAHRVRAAQILGWSEINAEIYQGSDDEARLWEIDENLIRHELNPLDRAVFLAERKQVYERMHPDTAGGVAGGKARQGSATDIMSFAKDTAERVGLTDRSIRRAVFIAQKLSPDVRALLPGMVVAQKQSELLALAKLGHSEQRQVLDLLRDPEAKIKGVGAALDLLKGVKDDVGQSDKGFTDLVSKWGRATPQDRAAFLRHLWAHQSDDTLRRFVMGLGQEEAA